MVLQNTKNNRIKGSFSSAMAFDLLLVLTWMRKTVVGYALTFVQRVPYIGVPIAKVYPFAFVALIVLALPYICKRLRLFELLFYGIGAIVVVCSAVVYPQYAEVISTNLSRILTAVFSMLFLGVGYDHARHKNLLFWSSFVGTITSFAYQVYLLTSGRELKEDSMYAAYLALPGILYLLYIAVETKKTVPWVVAGAASLTIFTYGTRGPLMCVLAFLSISLLMHIRLIPVQRKRWFFTCLVVAVTAWIFFSDVLLHLSIYLADIVGRLGFSTRIFDFFLEGEILDGNGRQRLIARALAKIAENPVFGYGLMSDRVLIGNYPHNIFVELWFQYGVLFGTALAALFVALPILALRSQRYDRSKRLLLYAFLCMSYGKLMLSSTYITEPYFFFTIGVCLSMIRQPSLKSVVLKQENEYD